MRVPHRGAATIEDLLARPEDERLELVNGSLVEKAAPSAPHSRAQGHIIRHVGAPFDRRPGDRFPGGWWILPELDIQLGADVFRPDVTGFRRDRVPELPEGRPVRIRPDWICEILSPSNRSHDRVVKLHRYLAAGVPHYWIVDAEEGTLEVYRHGGERYVLALAAVRGERVRAEPFDAVELSVSELLGGDPEDDAP